MKTSITIYLIVFVLLMGCNTVAPGPKNMEETISFLIIINTTVFGLIRTVE